MLGILTAVIAGGAAAGGFAETRRFVRRRLRYVEGIRDRRVPLIAGAVATVVAAPVVALLPLVGAGTALIFGGAVGYGTKKGADDIRQGRRDEEPV